MNLSKRLPTAKPQSFFVRRYDKKLDVVNLQS